MAITVRAYQEKPPEVQGVLWDKTGDTVDVATWAGGRMVNPTTIIVPDPESGEEGNVCTLPCYICKDGNRFYPLSTAEFTARYTAKVV